MDETTTNPFGQAASAPAAPEADHTPGGESTPDPALQTQGSLASTPAVTDSPAVERFKSCRWRCAPDEGSFCTHRDVLPFAGKEGFAADSWCPDCGFYKLRRTPKKRERVDYTY